MARLTGLLSLILLCTAALAEVNLVANPSFEVVQGGQPANWGVENWKLGGRSVFDETTAHSGARSVRVDCDSDAQRGIWRQIVPVQGPAHLRFSAWYKTRLANSSNGHGAVVRLVLFKDAAKWQELSLPMTWAPASDQWTELKTDVFLPAEGTAVGIELFNQDAAGSVWWDDITLRKATEAEMAEDDAQRLEQPPTPYTVRYAPAESSVSQLDPPAFVWLPVEGAKLYTLQYSRDAAFPAAKTTSVTCPRTIHVPRQTMGSGRWYWRFGITDEKLGGKIFSRVRAFSIAADAAAVPFPDVKQVVAKLQGVRPRDFIRVEDLQRYRDLAAGPLKQYVQNMKADCDRAYLDQPLLPEPAFLPKEGQERIVAYLNTFRSTRPFNGGMVACATVYLLTGEEKYGQEARRRLLHLASWDPNGSTNLFHNDEPGTELVRVMPRVYDWIYPLLTEEDKQKVRECLKARIPQVYKMLVDKPFEIHPYESHAMDYYIGDLLEACICMAGEIPVEEMLEYDLQQLWSPFFPPYGGDEGGWCEGPAYWQWSTATFLRDFTLVQQNCGVDLTRKPWLQNTPYFKLYCNPPYDKLSPFGDGQSGGPGAGDIMYKLGTALHNPYALWYASQQNAKPYGLDRFLFYNENDQGKPPSDLPQGRCFDDVGLACMHNDLAHGADNVQFLMRSSPFGSISHAYADQNAFALSAYGEPLAIASGYYPYYGSPHHTSWSWETKAANSVLVDGQGQNTRDWNARGRIVKFATSDYAHYALGDATEAYGGRLKRFYRHALYLRPVAAGDEPVVILYDDLVAQKPVTYQWLLHALEQMQVDEAGERVELKRGAAHLRVQFLTPQGLKFSQTDQFTAPPEAEKMPNQWHLTAQTTAPAPARGFLTVLLPYRVGKEAQVAQVKLLDKPGWAALEIISHGSRQVVAFRREAKPGEKIALNGTSTSADVFAAAWDKAGKPLATMQVRLDSADLRQADRGQ